MNSHRCFISIIDEKWQKFFKREFTSLCRRTEMEKDIIAWLLKKHRKSWESFYFTLSLKKKIDIIVIVWIVLWMSFQDTRIHFVVAVWKQKQPSFFNSTTDVSKVFWENQYIYQTHEEAIMVGNEWKNVQNM